MIVVKSGVIGVRAGTGTVAIKTSADPAFTLTPDDEARLVNRGVAAYAASGENEIGGEVETGLGYSADMKLAELKTLAAEIYGIDTAALRKESSKAGVIALIESAKLSADEDADDGADGNGEGDDLDDGDDGELPPELNAGEPIT